MTNSDKATLRAMIREGRSDEEIMQCVDCAHSIIRKYREHLKAIDWWRSNVPVSGCKAPVSGCKAPGALLVAGRLLADKTGSCPADTYDWEHPDDCAVICKPGCEAECWCLYAKHVSANETNEASGRNE